jgi:hypothetical protein
VTESTAVDNQEFHKAACAFCGGKIEFPASAGGMTVECPHCHQQTELRPVKRASRNISRLLIFMVAGIAVTIGALILLKARKHEKVVNPAPTVSPRSNTVPVAPEPLRPKALEDLKLQGDVSLEKAKGSSRLTYAMGTLKNDSDHQRYGVKVELVLFDQAGNKLPTQANDYIQMLEPHKDWKFRALVLDAKAVTAKVAAIREEP